MKKPELLLPVGNFEMAWAAIHNGADAIYVGAPKFNARGRTVDLGLSELERIIQTCHLYGVKVNLAFNVVIFENELEEAFELIKKLIALKPDAFIVQDLGLARLIRELDSDQAIHASTQMTVTNFEAIKLLDDLNIKRFVLGRENSIEEIKVIREQTNKELEVFVHGALCVSYSGQCFTSESLGGRSANRGQCAQSCRFSYDLYVDDTRKEMGSRKYLVSPQDLCGLEEVPELLNTQVDSFKIEGRLKSTEYVATTAKEYKKAILEQLNNLENSKDKLEVAYSRGFFTGWLRGVHHQKLVDGTYSAHRGALIGEIVDIVNNKMIIKTIKAIEINSGDGLLWVKEINKDEFQDGAQVYHSRQVGKLKIELEFSNQIELSSSFIGGLVYLNHQVKLEKEVQESTKNKDLLKKIPVKIEIELDINQKVKAKMTDGNLLVFTESEDVIQVAKTKASDDEFIIQEIERLGGTVFQSAGINILRKSNAPLFIPHQLLKEIRRNLSDQLAILRRNNKIKSFDEVQTSFSENSRLQAQSNKVSVTDKSKSEIKFHLLLRNKVQVEALVSACQSGTIKQNQIDSITLDFEFGRDYLQSVELLKKQDIKTGVATTRILKPKEYINLKAIEKLNPDYILVRNLGALYYYTQMAQNKFELWGDFSLNVTNHLSAEYLFNKGLQKICLSYDLNTSQIKDVLGSFDAGLFEVTTHQYMPTFHMEHCVFAAFLSKGSSYVDCGKPCEKHEVKLKDQFGNFHFIKPDHECRNTMYNANAISAAKFIPEWKNLGLGAIRFEALNEGSELLISKLRNYLDYIYNAQPLEKTTHNLMLSESYGLGLGNLNINKEHQNRKKI